MKKCFTLCVFAFVFSLSVHGQLKVAIYPYLPRSAQFQEVLTEEWNKLGTGIQLQFVNYDCYSSDPPDSLHVFVFDGIYLSYFQSQGYLAPVDTTQIEHYGRFWPFARQAVIVKNVVYGIPYLSCANVYFYRKSDPKLNTGTDIGLNSFYSVIGTASDHDTIPPLRKGLLLDYSGSTTDACLYVAGWMNYYRRFTTNPPLPPYTELDPAVVKNLRTYTNMAGIAQASYSDPGTNRITWFSQGHGRAMIGITENSASLPHSYLDSIGFRLMPLANEPSYTQNFFVDMAGMNSKTPAGLQKYAVMLLHLMTSDNVMFESMIPYKGNPNPQFLIPVSSSVLKRLTEQVHPLYRDIYDLLAEHRPYQFLLPQASRQWLKDNKSHIRSILLQKGTEAKPKSRQTKKQYEAAN